MATSPARIASNRANALKSTGPHTAAGKARSARNAWVHGLWTAGFRTPVNAGFILQLTSEYRPATAAERNCIFWIAATLSRIYHLDEIEEAVWKRLHTGGERLIRAIYTLGRHQNAADLAFHRLVRKLDGLKSTTSRTPWVRTSQKSSAPALPRSLASFLPAPCYPVLYFGRGAGAIGSRSAVPGCSGRRRKGQPAEIGSDSSIQPVGGSG